MDDMKKENLIETLDTLKLRLDEVWDEENGLGYNECIYWEKYYKDRIEKLENVLALM